MHASSGSSYAPRSTGFGALVLIVSAVFLTGCGRFRDGVPWPAATPAPVVVESTATNVRISGFRDRNAIKAVLRGLPANTIRTVARTGASQADVTGNDRREVAARPNALVIETSARDREPISDVRAQWHVLLTATAVVAADRRAGRNPPTWLVTVLRYPDGTTDVPTEMEIAWSPTVPLTGHADPAAVAADLRQAAAGHGMRITAIELHPRTGFPSPEIVIELPDRLARGGDATSALADVQRAAEEYGPFLVDVRDRTGQPIAILMSSPPFSTGGGYQRQDDRAFNAGG